MSRLGPHLLEKLIGEVQRFRDKAFLKAVLAVCALTARADGELHNLEIKQIEAAFRDLPALRGFDRRKAKAIFKQYDSALESGDRRARTVLYKKIRVFEGHFKRTRTLLRVAYLVITADGQAHPQEMREFKRICGVLGLDPGTVWGELSDPGKRVA